MGLFLAIMTAAFLSAAPPDYPGGMLSGTPITLKSDRDVYWTVQHLVHGQPYEVYIYKGSLVHTCFDEAGTWRLVLTWMTSTGPVSQVREVTVRPGGVCPASASSPRVDIVPSWVPIWGTEPNNSVIEVNVGY